MRTYGALLLPEEEEAQAAGAARSSKSASDSPRDDAPTQGRSPAGMQLGTAERTACAGRSCSAHGMPEVSCGVERGGLRRSARVGMW